MSIQLEEKEVREAIGFLSKYIAEHDGSDDAVLVRPNCYCMTKDEIEGEILDLILSYLSRRYFLEFYILCDANLANLVVSSAVILHSTRLLSRIFLPLI